MTEVESRIRRWGNSFGVIIPNEVIKKEKLKEGQKVGIIILKKSDALKRTFGMMKGEWKEPAQYIKDKLRKELYDE